jgi:hypothetical protein
MNTAALSSASSAASLGPRLAWSARQWVSRLGWPGLAGLAMLALALVFCASMVLPHRAERDAALENSLQLRASVRRALLHPEAQKPGRAQQLRTFYSLFPAADTLPDWLGRIYAAANRRGLPLELGQYKASRDPGARLMRYQLIFPVKGGYAAVRGFIGEVLREVPTAALDDLELKRDSIGSDVIEARLRMTLFITAPDQ